MIEDIESSIETMPAEVPHNQNGSFDVNLILMVEEHGPRRIKEIEKEIESLVEKVRRLEAEKGIINQLVAVVTK